MVGQSIDLGVYLLDFTKEHMVDIGLLLAGFIVTTLLS